MRTRGYRRQWDDKRLDVDTIVDLAVVLPFVATVELSKLRAEFDGTSVNDQRYDCVKEQLLVLLKAVERGENGTLAHVVAVLGAVSRGVQIVFREYAFTRV